ncbi:hypothetical protein AD929_12990 [Gluconobacter potus]|uniref:Uncharacterized protein n=1 Tax=Gluconobacter potus TaxID=2724927 RepID=A0A149QS84_9PROT|nr:hypothetical protein [Gluconobacter potus]KXV00121.1 hypothetical protein AD929_12990 [Gluconobacter potus]
MNKPVLSPVELLTDLEGRLTLSRRADLSVNIARALLEQAEQKKSDIDDGIDTLLDRAAAAVDTTVLRQMAESRLDALLSNGFIKLEPLEDTVPVVEIAPAPVPARRRRRRSQSQDEQSTETVPADEATPAAAAPVVEAPAVETPAAEAPVVDAPVLEASVVEAPVVEDKPSVVSAVSEVAPAEIEVLGPVSTKAEPLAGNVEDLAVDIDELPDLSDAANVEDTRQDVPVADAPVVEAPAVETPVVEAPVVEQVQAAPERAEDAAPAAEPADKEEVAAPARPSLTLRRSFASRQSA